MSISREESAMVGLEIVAFAGEARSKLIMALDEAEKGNYEKATSLIEEANESLLEAHKSQTEMLTAEARGENVELGFIMVNGQDHLMTTMLLRDVMKHLVNLYKVSNIVK